MSINRWTDTQNVVHLHTGILFGHEKGWSPDTRYNVDGPWEHDAQWEKPDTEGHTGCDSIDGKRPEQADPQTERMDSWLPGVGEGVGVTAHGDGISFWGDGMLWD